MKLALHRSITFWSGLLVMVFICWCWWDSLRATTTFTRGHVCLSNSLSGLKLTYHPLRSAPPLYRLTGTPRAFPYRQHLPPPLFVHLDEFSGSDRTDYYLLEADNRTLTPRSTAAAYLDEILIAPVPNAWGLFIPHWLILLAAALPWLALLVWRARRRKHTFTP